jgi:hypothetical protein
MVAIAALLGAVTGTTLGLVSGVAKPANGQAPAPSPAARQWATPPASQLRGPTVTGSTASPAGRNNVAGRHATTAADQPSQRNNKDRNHGNGGRDEPFGDGRANFDRG